jgi:HNH endonuclease
MGTTLYYKSAPSETVYPSLASAGAGSLIPDRGGFPLERSVIQTTNAIQDILRFGNPRDVKRFLAKIQVNQETRCWLWTASCHYREGYGKFGYQGRTIEAHRWAWLATHGAFPPPPFELDHLCRVRRCVNPFHLEAVTARENLLRGIGPSAQNAAKTHCKRGHEFTAENTGFQPRSDRPQPYRVCLVCKKGRAENKNPGKQNRNKTHCPQGHVYSPENTHLYRGWRYCRTCDRIRSRVSR